MSIALAPIDLTGQTVGYTKDIPLGNLGINSFSGPGQVLFIVNDSGCGLQCTFDTGSAFFVGAGGWVPQPVPPNVTSLHILVVYALPFPPVSTVLLTFYGRGEQVPQFASLGNSPIGGSTKANVGTLSNEGQPANTLIIDIGDVNYNSLWAVYNDHFFISVDVAGVAHQVLGGNTGSAILAIGHPGDVSEVYGTLQVDQGIAFPAGSISRIKYTHIASVTTTAAFFNHNLGVTPDACIIVPNDGTLSTGNFNAYYESSSMTSTQVKLQSNSVAGIPVGLWAIKF